jgi:hypothetical protein
MLEDKSLALTLGGIAALTIPEQDRVSWSALSFAAPIELDFFERWRRERNWDRTFSPYPSAAQGNRAKTPPKERRGTPN